MITVEGLSKSYAGTSFAVQGVSFRVDKGEVVGFLGPNGAGKTTTLRVVAGFLGMTEGKVTLAGHDIVGEPMKARAAVGYMPETVPMYPEMRVREYLAFRAELKGVARDQRRSFIDVAMTQAKIEDVADQLIAHLSKGYRQRVGLADALVARPPILILDEPTAGLDPNQIREVRSLICELGRDHAVLLSTHILSEVEATCDRALVISKGTLVAEGTIDALRKRRRSRGVHVAVAGEADVRAALSGVVAVDQITDEGEGRYTISWRDDVEDLDAAAESVSVALVAAGLRLRELSPAKASLEQVFAELTEAAT
jgi:ABC-2 type transport system ATP-binding protein